MLTGDNGILQKATEAKEQIEIAQIEEEANMIFLEKSFKNHAENNGNINISDIVTKLQSKGYTIEQKNSGEGATDITVSTVINVPKGGSTDLVVTPIGGDDGIDNYYAVVQGKYYRIIEPINNGIRIDRTPTIFQNIQKLTATIKTGSSVSIGTIKGYKIALTAIADSGDTTIKVQYGNITKECIATVRVIPTETSLANANKDITFKTDYGTIEVIWLKDNGKIVSATPNEPVYGPGMSPVSWIEKPTIEEDNVKWEESSTENYEYKVATEKIDSKQSKWANAKLKIDEIDSYFVWIPRYAYRITYYDDQNDTTPNGYYDGWGMWKADDGTVRYTLENEDVDTVEYNGNKYIIHPAFCDGTRIGYDNGAWSCELKGFWVAKYEISRSTSNGTSQDQSSTYSGVAFRSIANVSSARNISIGNMYTLSKAFNTTNKSHLMKNSEWGAVAYLAHSQYGRNGFEIDINNSSYYITGNGSGSTTTTTSVAGVANEYNTEIGANASTTGNIYGVYDLSGGANEYVAAFNTKDDPGRYSSYANSFASIMGESDEYATKYDNQTSSVSGHKTIFNVGKVGDATKEVSRVGGDSSTSTTNKNNWFEDSPYVCGPKRPFISRGSAYNSGASSGLFFSNYNQGFGGNAYQYDGFRVTLCP